MITVERWLAALPPATRALCLDREPAAGEEGDLASDAGVWSCESSQSLAYVLYTSGSTGTPKRVAVPHRAVVRLVRGTGYAHFGPDEVYLQLAPLSFDASTFEIWAPLLHGGRLVVPPPGAVSLAELGEILPGTGPGALESAEEGGKRGRRRPLPRGRGGTLRRVGWQ